MTPSVSPSASPSWSPDHWTPPCSPERVCLVVGEENDEKEDKINRETLRGKVVREQEDERESTLNESRHIRPSLSVSA